MQLIDQEIVDMDNQDLFSEINMTPFIDVVLVLLMMLMFSAQAFVQSVQQGEFDIQLPESKSTSVSQQQHQTIRVQLSRQQEIRINQKTIAKEILETTLKQLFNRYPHETVMIEADGSIAHRDVIHMMDMIQSAGFRKIGIRTDHES